jgi:glutamyl-Q tRNA(Asp) synthetase
VTQPVFRFAPSPNGLLHLGHALSALTGYEMARRAGGRFLLRIEDIDQSRARPELIQAIFDDLAWLGLRWEEPVFRQSEHMGDYLAAARPLIVSGLLYPCFASRAEIMAAAELSRFDPEGMPLYPGLWRGRPQTDVAAAMARDPRHALRLDMARAIEAVQAKLGKPLTFTELDDSGGGRGVIADPARWGDVTLLRKEFASSYLLSVVVDDARQGVTHVTRGQDLYAATDVQRVLQVLLDLPEPHYHHHRLILGRDGQKLSKSRADTSLASLRSEGATPSDIRRAIGFG